MANAVVACLLSLAGQLDTLLFPTAGWEPTQPAPIYHRAPDAAGPGGAGQRFLAHRGEPLSAESWHRLQSAFPEHRRFDLTVAAGVALFHFLALAFFRLVLLASRSHLLLRFRSVASVFLTLVFATLGTRLLLDFTPLSTLAAPALLPVLWFTPLLGRTPAFALHLLMVAIAAYLSHFPPATFLVLLIAGWSAASLLAREASGARILFASLVATASGTLCMLLLARFTPQALSFALTLESDFTGLALGCLGTGLTAVLLRPAVLVLFGATPRHLLNRLNDLDHPLMRELAQKAPGTFQHSLAVANMAEKVAHDIQADALLARVGAYYHDIGKMQRPEAFVENQKDDNVHDRLSPEASARMVRGHVENGLAIAQGAHLPRRLMDFIVEHHGRSTVEYFLDKALRTDGRVSDPSAFEYRGRNPTSRETGVVMIVDAVEAASRTLVRPDREAVVGLVRQILFEKLIHGYLDDSGLSPRDLKQIGQSLIQFLTAQFHMRVEYPWQRRFDRLSSVTSPNLAAFSVQQLRVARPLDSAAPHTTPPPMPAAALPALPTPPPMANARPDPPAAAAADARSPEASAPESAPAVTPLAAADTAPAKKDEEPS